MYLYFKHIYLDFHSIPTLVSGADKITGFQNNSIVILNYEATVYKS